MKKNIDFHFGIYIDIFLIFFYGLIFNGDVILGIRNLCSLLQAIKQTINSSAYLDMHIYIAGLIIIMHIMM